MKKIILISMAVLLVAAMSLPAAAVENEFSGYWRTRGYAQKDIDGTDSGTNSVVDTRTRLYYTAKLNENFKFVNKFEFNSYWGDSDGGNIGTDGKTFTVKHSYVDFNLDAVNLKVGLQPTVISRGFLFDDDFAGATITYNAGGISIPFTWMNASNSDIDNYKRTFSPSGDLGFQYIDDLLDQANITLDGTNINTDMFVVNPTINIGDNQSVTPYLMYVKTRGTDLEGYDTGVYYLGADVDVKVDDVSLWGTFVYEGGKIVDYDVSAYLMAVGADAGLVHGQVFYASGDDGKDDDVDMFMAPSGQSYLWSEIMGDGNIFDVGASNNSPGGSIGNIMAVNVGTTIKPMDKLTLTGDIWYAQLVEDIDINADNVLPEKLEKNLGVEVDLVASYQVMDNLKLDVVAAYLFAGDATGKEDPIEVGTQLSLSF